MRRVTRLFRIAAFAVAATALPGALFAQTPTPTATPTPTPTPTPLVPATQLPASAGSLGIPNGGRYDASNMILEADGTIWTASANENVVARISADEKKVRKWTFPKDAAPSHLLREPDGSFWVAQLGGFKVSRFNPATAELTEWPDQGRRPTAFVKKADGTLWLPETNGTLTNFDPATGTFVYWRSTDTENPISSLTYPYLDADGSIWTADFLRGNLLRYAPDGSRVTKWPLPDPFAQPSKIIRGPDGHLWISLYNAAQLARFDPATGELKTFAVGVFVLPFDLQVYKDRIAYTEQQGGEVGVLDPRGVTPTATATLQPTLITLTSTTETVVPARQTLATLELDVSPTNPVVIEGSGTPGLARYPATGAAGYALVVDDVRKRFLVGTAAQITEVLPPLPATVDDHLYPAAASIGGAGGARWATQFVAWNRGTADAAGATADASVNARLLPTDWIVGISPTTNYIVGPGKIIAKDDPIGDEMGGTDTSGALRFTTSSAATRFADFYSWIRVYRTREDGGTYGFARNFIKGGQGIGAGESGFFFTPPDPAPRVNAGLLVIEAATGTVTLVDAAGNPLAGTYSFHWPAGYHVQQSMVFHAFGVAPSPSARVVYSVTAGRVLPFGTSIDEASGDPIDLPFFGARSTAAYQWVHGVERGGGTLGSTSRTDLQLFNAAAGDATVSLVFRAARLASGGPAPSAPPATVTVPAGKVVTLADVVKSAFGLEGVSGTIEISSEPPVHAFARVTAEDASGGRHGYGSQAVFADTTATATANAVFIQASDTGWDVMETERVGSNPTDGPAQVTVRAFDVGGIAAGEPLALSLGPKEVVRVPAAFYNIAGFGAPFGRLEIAPATGSQPVFAILLRADRKTGDADAIPPYIVPST